ncbi:MAG: autotransporter domain-containing protein [Saprospiraceae bacterium]|nr:autotransporter domain-containing protein [Saprospiraceae bacterium]
MASRNKTNDTLTISEKLNQSAYSCYSSATIVPSGDRSTATGLKRFFAAALLSSSSIMVLASPAAAEAGPCMPGMPANGATVNCTGVTTASQTFTGDDLTIVADENFSQDTSANVIGVQRVNAGIFITGSGGTIRHSGTIRTGEVPEGAGTYGRHNGLYIIGGAGDVTAENTATGSITTTAAESAGIQVSATTGTSTAINRGTLLTQGRDSYGVASSNANIAISQNFGTVTTQGYQSHGLYSYTSTTSGSATSTNAAGATINISGDQTAAVIAIAKTGNGTATASSAGTINVAGDDSTGGVAAIAVTGAANASNTGRINLSSTDVDKISGVGYADVGVFAASHAASSTNGVGGSIVDTGAGTSIGVYATTASINPFVGPVMGGAIPAGATATGTNDGTITLTGDRSIGIAVNGSGGTSTATNNGSVTVTGNYVAGISTSGETTNVNNTGSVTVTGNGSYGVRATSISKDTTNVTNSGTITQSGGFGMTRYGATAVFASGPTVNVTNTSNGTITGADTAIRVGFATTATVVNAGTINGDIVGSGRRKLKLLVPGPESLGAPLGVGKFVITNTGTINGRVAPGYYTSSVITNNGGTIGDGTYATYTGSRDDVVTITGSGNVINGAFRDEGGTGAGNNTINFNQSDTLTLNGTSRGYAFFGFETANFNSGTTVIAQERGIGTFNKNGSRVNVNAGATLTTSSRNLGINTNQLTVSGRGATRGTLHAPAGSNIVVTRGNTTFEAGGRFRVGVASDTSAGYLNGGSGTVTFNSGSEIYADVTRGITLTEGAPGIKIAGVDAGEGGMIVDNNAGGVKVYDNTVIFSFTSEVRNNSELYLIAKRELRARVATTNGGGRTNAEKIATAIDEFIDNAPTDNVIVQYLAQFPVDQQEQKLFELVKDSLPSESGASGSSTVASTDMVLDLIMDRLSGGGFTVVDSGERQTGLAAGEQFLGGPGNWALWGRAGASFAEFEPSGVNGFDSDTYAVSLGIDGDMTDDLRMGVALFYSDTKVDETGTGANSNQDIEGYGALLYGTYRPEDFYVNATVGFGFNEYDSRRNAAGGVNTANYDGTQFMSRVEVGKVFTDGAWDLSPHVGLRFNKVSIDGYTETGPLPTTISRQSLTSLRAVLGVSGRYTHVLEDGAKLIPEAYVRGLQELAGPNDAITGNVVGGGTFISQSTERDKFSYAAGAGLTYEMDDQFSVRFLYDGEFQADYQEHSITAAIRYQF